MIDQKSHPSNSEYPTWRTSNRPVIGCAITAVAVNDPRDARDHGGFAAPMRHQHEERDASPGPEQHGRTVQKFQTETGHHRSWWIARPPGRTSWRHDLEQGAERITHSTAGMITSGSMAVAPSMRGSGFRPARNRVHSHKGHPPRREPLVAVAR